MTRIDLGALVSRAMAIWLLAETLYAAPSEIEPVIHEQVVSMAQRLGSLSPLILVAIKVAAIWLLWSKASGFGQWLDKSSPEDSPPLTLNRNTVSVALVQGVAAYWVIAMAIGLALYKADEANNPEAPAASLANAAGFGWPYVILFVLSVLFLFNAHGVARKLCTV